MFGFISSSLRSDLVTANSTSGLWQNTQVSFSRSLAEYLKWRSLNCSLFTDHLCSCILEMLLDRFFFFIMMIWVICFYSSLAGEQVNLISLG